jgi:hypothetical protein
MQGTDTHAVKIDQARVRRNSHGALDPDLAVEMPTADRQRPGASLRCYLLPLSLLCCRDRRETKETAVARTSHGETRQRMMDAGFADSGCAPVH